MTTTCEWPVSYSACGTDEDGNPDCFASPEQQAMFEEMAADYLGAWTGFSLGTCPVTVRPCRADCEGASTFWGRGPFPWSSSGNLFPVLIGGQWFNLGCGTCGGDLCSCEYTSSLILPGPVAAITSVVIGTETVDPSAYRVDNYSLLVRTDGGRWPTCQDMGAAPAAEGYFGITYDRGLPVPVGGQVAAGILACEFAKAACKDKSCQLPERIQSITRQGVTVTLIDDFKNLQSGQTGIWLIDSWMASVMQPSRRGRVYSVDVPRPNPRVTTWSAPAPG